MQIGADGTETLVRDWTTVTDGGDRAAASSVTFPWTPSAADVSLRVDVRDASYALHSTTLRVGSSPAPQPQTGEWKQDSRGWWYRNADGSYTTNNWQNSGGKRYCFEAAGWMKTGWIQWGNKWYYGDASGAMLVNTTTPDGLRVGADGAWVQ